MMIKEQHDIVRKLLSFSSDNLFENLSEEDKKLLLSNCSVIFNNPALEKICNEAYTKEVLNTIEHSQTIEDLAEGRGKIMGIASVIAMFGAYNAEYIANTKKEELFDKNKAI